MACDHKDEEKEAEIACLDYTIPFPLPDDQNKLLLMLFYCGSFNPPHLGHMDTIAQSCNLLKSIYDEYPILLISMKSDERLSCKLQTKNDDQNEHVIHFNLEQRKMLFRQVWHDFIESHARKQSDCCIGQNPNDNNAAETKSDLGDIELWFDDNFSSMSSKHDGNEIRKITDNYYHSRLNWKGKVMIYRVLGTDSVQKYNLFNDNLVIHAIRQNYEHNQKMKDAQNNLIINQYRHNDSSTNIRKLLIQKKYDQIKLPQTSKQLLVKLLRKCI